MTDALAIARGSRSVITAIVANVALVVAKCSVGIVGHSYALIADGVESMSDVVSSIVVYGGLRVAVRPADANHPYGHGKAGPLAALVVAGGPRGAAVRLRGAGHRED